MNRVTRLSILKEIEKELERFKKRLKEAIKDAPDETYPGPSRHYATAKRAALDLKNGLTKLTQDSRYMYKIRNQQH